MLSAMQSEKWLHFFIAKKHRLVTSYRREVGGEGRAGEIRAASGRDWKRS